jgi:hypothetical protein
MGRSGLILRSSAFDRARWIETFKKENFLRTGCRPFYIGSFFDFVDAVSLRDRSDALFEQKRL